MSKALALTCLIGACLVTPMAFAQQGGAPAATPTQRTGAQVYTDACVSCHGRDLKGASAKTLFSPEVTAKSDAALTKAIASGAAPDHAFKGKITENQIFQLVTYIRLQGGNLQPKPAFVENPNGQVVKSQKQTFRVETVADGLETPWGMAFLPDGRLLVTERPGRLRILGKDGKLSEPVKNTPKVWERQDAGMLDIVVHPDYAKSGWLYMAYTDLPAGVVAPPPPPAPPPGQPAARVISPPSMTVLIRGHINANNEWTDTQELYRAPAELYTPSGAHYGARFLFDGKGHVFYSIGERGDMTNAQKLSSPLGKIHRINDDGTIPTDNPFYNTPGAVKTIWSYGHRNPEGMDYDPVTGLMWESEHGPTGGDEINIVEKGKNYGWGVTSMGIQPGIFATTGKGMETPIVYYTPTMAPSGIRFYRGDKYPGWKNNLFVSMLAGGRLMRLEVKGRKVVSQEAVFNQFGRVREVTTGPDGLLYVLLQNPTGQGTGLSLAASTPGRLIRLAPQ
jgi:glucose/arabinose dehydrogenase